MSRPYNKSVYDEEELKEKDFDWFGSPISWWINCVLVFSFLASYVFISINTSKSLGAEETRIMNFDTTRYSDLIMYGNYSNINTSELPQYMDNPLVLLYENYPTEMINKTKSISESFSLSRKEHKTWHFYLHKKSSITIQLNSTNANLTYILIRSEHQYKLWKSDNPKASGSR